MSTLSTSMSELGVNDTLVNRLDFTKLVRADMNLSLLW